MNRVDEPQFQSRLRIFDRRVIPGNSRKRLFASGRFKEALPLFLDLLARPPR